MPPWCLLPSMLVVLHSVSPAHSLLKYWPHIITPFAKVLSNSSYSPGLTSKPLEWRSRLSKLSTCWEFQGWWRGWWNTSRYTVSTVIVQREVSTQVILRIQSSKVKVMDASGSWGCLRWTWNTRNRSTEAKRTWQREAAWQLCAGYHIGLREGRGCLGGRASSHQLSHSGNWILYCKPWCTKLD